MEIICDLEKILWLLSLNKGDKQQLYKDQTSAPAFSIGQTELERFQNSDFVHFFDCCEKDQVFARIMADLFLDAR